MRMPAASKISREIAPYLARLLLKLALHVDDLGVFRQPWPHRRALGSFDVEVGASTAPLV
jgi:hypothetical protein